MTHAIDVLRQEHASMGRMLRLMTKLSREIAAGRDIGSVIVTRDGRDVAYVVTFAFAFFAFNPRGTVLTVDGRIGRD